MQPGSAAIAAPIHTRNGRLDGRTRAARRQRDLIAELTTEIGAPDARQRVVIQNIAAMVTRFEMLTKAALAGAPTDDDGMVRLANSISRLLAALRKGAQKRGDAPDLRTYLNTRDEQKRTGEPLSGIFGAS